MRALVIPFVLAAGCAARMPLPMTAGELVDYDSAPALVAYLGQPDASPAVCDPQARGPHVRAFTPEIRLALAHGLESGKIEPALWGRCIAKAVRALPADPAASLVDDAMQAYRRMVEDKDLATSPALAARVTAAQRLYVDREPGIDGHAKVLQPIFGELRERLAAHELSAVASRFVGELVASVDVDHGVWQGQPVDVALLDRLAAEGNEMTLQRFATRLPDPALREQAKRRIVRVHVALSPFDEVRANAPAVEEAVMHSGDNRIALADHSLDRAWIDETKATLRDVLVRQHVWQQTAKLLGYAPGRPTLSVLPEIKLRNSLWAELDGVSRPVTLCAPPRALDPSPCLDILDVTLANPLAYLERDRFRLLDNLYEADVLPWASSADFELPVLLAGRPAVSLHWGLYFERPENVVLEGGTGGRGPDLAVRVEHPNGQRYVFHVAGPQGAYSAVVEARDLPAFRIASAGGGGYAGSSGSDGTSGSSGGECQNGGDGGPGGNGGPGGDGGNGGNVLVELACGPAGCDVDLLHQVIVSVGGAGGPGGSGGRGGAGGSGGSGRSPTTHTDSDGNTVTDDAGCSAGSSGSNGADGSTGSSGSDGYPGTVTFVVGK